jgi:hypothetical protein
MITSLQLRWRVALVGCVAAFACPSVFAVNFLVDGMVTTCSALACNAAGIAVGDQITGFVTVDDTAAMPNSTITEADVLGYTLTVGDVTTGGDEGMLASAALLTDGQGEIESGTALFETTVDTGFGIADVELTLDAALGTWEASTDFFGLGTIATGTLTLTREVIAADADSDGVTDDADNCTEVANPDQRDTNGDLFGNACDPDLDNNGIVNAIDLGLFKSVFFTADPDADFDGNGVVNVVDLGVLKTFFFLPPGPSGLVAP